PYLPYGLKVFRDTGETSEILELSSGKIMLWQDGYYESFKPILRPLSDVLEIKEFAHIHTLIKHHIGRTRLERLVHEGYGIVDLPYFITEYFFENHIDFFDLIGKGLAIDINSIEK